MAWSEAGLAMTWSKAGLEGLAGLDEEVHRQRTEVSTTRNVDYEKRGYLDGIIWQATSLAHWRLNGCWKSKIIGGAGAAPLYSIQQDWDGEGQDLVLGLLLQSGSGGILDESLGRKN